MRGGWGLRTPMYLPSLVLSDIESVPFLAFPQPFQVSCTPSACSACCPSYRRGRHRGVIWCVLIRREECGQCALKFDTMLVGNLFRLSDSCFSLLGFVLVLRSLFFDGDVGLFDWVRILSLVFVQILSHFRHSPFSFLLVVRSPFLFGECVDLSHGVHMSKSYSFRTH